MSMNTDVTTDAQVFLETLLKRWNLTMTEWNQYINMTDLSSADFSLGEDMNIDVNTRPPCTEAVRWIRHNYKPIHGYLALIVCLFGTIANLFNIVVLTRKDMISPTNAILTGLAIADMVVMMEYIPFAVQHYIMQDTEHSFTYHATLYVLFHAHFAQIFHTIAIWMTVMLAVWRFLSICHPHTVSRCCSMQRSVLYIACAYIVSPIICIPSYFTFTLSGRPTSDGLLYRIDISKAARAYGGLLSRANFWMYSVLIKLIPCLALTYFSVRMIGVLLETKKRKRRLMSGCRQLSGDHHLLKSQRQTDRTTWMLMAVLLLFLVTEFPQGILALLSAVLPDRFFRTCYLHVGELLDILALVNSAVNFLLYCLMSKQFRTTFRTLLRLTPQPCQERRSQQAKLIVHASKVTDTTFV